MQNNIDQNLWNRISNYVRSKLSNLLDPSFLFSEDAALRKDSDIKHKGFYVGVVDSSDSDVMREGFLQHDLTNLLDSCDIVIKNMAFRLKNNLSSKLQIETSMFYFTVIDEIIYLKNPLQWNESADGIFFQWGQMYKGVLLPYQIVRMQCKKTEIMNRMCSYDAGIISSAWRLPEGMVYRLVCKSFKS